MPREDLCTKAASTLSGFFRKAAAVIDQLTAEHASWEGKFPHALQFDVHPTSDGFQLCYSLKDIRDDELELVHDASNIYLHVRPSCYDYLIPSFDDLRAETGLDLDDEVLEKFGNLRWEDATPKDVSDYFWAINTKEGEHLWTARANVLLGLVVTIARAKSQQSGKPVTGNDVRSLLSLDVLLDEHASRRLPEHVANKLALYLAEIPGYTEEDALNGCLTTKAYEQHGFLSMQCTPLFSPSFKSAPSRAYRLRSAEIEFESPAPIAEVKAKVGDGVLTIDLTCIETGLKRVNIQL